jgi:hypothetical protein
MFTNVIANPIHVGLVSQVVLSHGVVATIAVQVEDGLYHNRFPLGMFILLVMEVFKCLH